MTRDRVDPQLIQVLHSFAQSQNALAEGAASSWIASVLLAPFNVFQAMFGSLLSVFTEAGSWSARPPLLLTALTVHLLALGLFSSLQGLQCIPMGTAAPKQSAGGMLQMLGLAKLWEYYLLLQGAFNSFCLFVASLVLVLSVRVVLSGSP